MLLRLLLGIGESAAFPCASKLLAQSFEVARLGIANGVLSFGYLLGPAVGTLVGGLLLARFGWRAVFTLFGACSLAWLLPWRRVIVAPRTEPGIGDPPPPGFPAILRQRALWGAALGLFAGNYGFYFILAWLPFYLVKTRGFSLDAMAWTASWAYLLNAVSALLMGWLTDRWVRAGYSPTRVYKGVMATVHARRHRLHDRHGCAADHGVDRIALPLRGARRPVVPCNLRGPSNPCRARRGRSLGRGAEHGGWSRWPRRAGHHGASDRLDRTIRRGIRCSRRLADRVIHRLGVRRATDRAGALERCGRMTAGGSCIITACRCVHFI